MVTIARHTSNEDVPGGAWPWHTKTAQWKAWRCGCGCQVTEKGQRAHDEVVPMWLPGC
eukprot:NODE_5634_length_566_cov_207.602740.p5 GENE.NODE_5634_length_566_cov_207.602740~~NODE_5634_length_566_cov_207.602740.p5  ORF type:complete len:58 (-),score=1.70 NODE_5634_length_566_cov_207.602740:300-473(-)